MSATLLEAGAEYRFRPIRHGISVVMRSLEAHTYFTHSLTHVFTHTFTHSHLHSLKHIHSPPSSLSHKSLISFLFLMPLLSLLSLLSTSSSRSRTYINSLQPSTPALPRSPSPSPLPVKFDNGGERKGSPCHRAIIGSPITFHRRNRLEAPPAPDWISSPSHPKSPGATHVLNCQRIDGLCVAVPAKHGRAL